MLRISNLRHNANNRYVETFNQLVRNIPAMYTELEAYYILRYCSPFDRWEKLRLTRSSRPRNHLHGTFAEVQPIAQALKEA